MHVSVQSIKVAHAKLQRTRDKNNDGHVSSCSHSLTQVVQTLVTGFKKDA